MEGTFVILKPDAVKRKLVGEIISRFERKGFQIVKMQMVVLDKDIIKEHYSHLASKPFFGRIEEYMVSGPCILMILSGKDAIKTVRSMMGCTNALEALPGTIRGDYGSDAYENLIHGSDSQDSFIQEVKRFFPDFEIV